MYGQYSAGTAGRLTKADMTPARAVVSRKAGHNRLIWTDAAGATHFRLIQTDIATVEPDGTVTLRDGGWPTMTTRRALSEALAVLAPEFTKIDQRWGAANVWGSKGHGADSTLLLMRYTPKAAPEHAWDTTEYQRRAVPFNREIRLRMGANGVEVVSRDSDAPEKTS